ncbi:hypothetical protein Ddye_021801 [Dipteronia dyeriana]|uniref:Uncharacterized protein n=1 Tax=Dipteronia dyeriana TaxID=168575 RepID=A0AAD9WX79_9ROSI|nr:hypothetical protein Ddye_021801 [Dipteronia dyeriana]
MYMASERSPPPPSTYVASERSPSPPSTSVASERSLLPPSTSVPSEQSLLPVNTSKCLGKHEWQLVSPYTDPCRPKRLRTRPESVEHIFDPHELVDTDHLMAYKVFKRNIDGEQRDVDVLAPVTAGWFVRMQSNFMDLVDTPLMLYMWERMMPRDTHDAVTTVRWNVLQSRWLEEDLLSVRGATTSGNRPWQEVDLVSGPSINLCSAKIDIYDPWRQEVLYQIRHQQVRQLRWFLLSMLSDAGFHTAGRRVFPQENKPFSVSLVHTSTVPQQKKS